MKKFLIVLAMVVTASLLMGAGCFTVNTPPVITTLALPDATVGTAYTATVEATDADGDALTFSVGGPTGMVISEAGVISGWTPTESGTENVLVAVTDGADLVSANFIITVSAVEPEPGPEPELQLVGIEVDPKTMDLIAGMDEEIETVTATYEFRGYGVIVPLGDCTFLSTDEDVATVAIGVVTAVEEGAATIIVSYGGKVDTIAVTVIPVELDHIVVLPKTIDLVLTGPDKTINSVTAYYNDESTVGIALGDCTYLSDHPGVADVEEVGGVVTVAAGTLTGEATITVSYTEEGITETDTVEVTVSNNPPVIDTSPILTAIVGDGYIYDVDATDPDDGDVLTYSLTTEPFGMLIAADSGIITWNAANIIAAGGVGDYDVVVVVTDVGGLFAIQEFTITITAGTLTTITIRSATDGEGDEIPDQDMMNGTTLVLFAAGYNEFGIYMGDQSVDWTLTNTLGATTGDLDPLIGVSTTFTAGTALESGKIEAADGIITDATGTITVI